MLTPWYWSCLDLGLWSPSPRLGMATFKCEARLLMLQQHNTPILMSNTHELFTEQTTSVCPLPPPSSPFWHFLPRSPHLVLSTAPTRYWMTIISQLFSDPPWGNQAAFHWTEAQPKDYHVFREQKMQTSSQISIFWEKTQGVKGLRKSHRKRTQVRLSVDWEILS